MTDRELSETLSSWKLEPCRDSNLKSEVWATIERRESRPLSDHLCGLFDSLFSPKIGVPVAISVLVLTTIIANVHAKHHREAILRDISISYQQTIDPSAGIVLDL